MRLNKFEFTSLEKLTIIIPTYNRQAFALRSMRYWSGSNVKIVVIDGSEKSIDSLNLNQFKSNIKYIHCQDSYFKRMLYVIDLVETEYVIFGNDDEFYIPSALNTCILKLSSDSKLLTCGGRSALFDWKNNLVVGSNIYPRLKNLFLLDTVPADRVKKLFSNYTPTHYYSVARTEIRKIVMKEVFARQYSCIEVGELQLEFLMAYAGNTLIIPELMWLRSNENESITFGKNILRVGTFPQWWLLKNFKKEKNDFLKRMEHICKEINKIIDVRYSTEVSNLFDLYLKNYRKNKNMSLLHFFFQYFPLKFKNIIKKIYKYFEYKSIKQISLIDHAKLLEVTNVKIDFDELKKIEKIINSFYKRN